MAKTIYFINPADAGATYFGAEILEQIAPADLNTAVDIVGLTGKSTQVARMIELADAYRQRGKLVMIGGPFASLCRDPIRPHGDCLLNLLLRRR